MSKEMELVLELKLQVKMLESQAKRENNKFMKERQLAKTHLSKGEKQFAQYHCQTAARAEQMTKYLLDTATSIQSMISDVEMARIQKDSVKRLKKASKDMEKCIGTMDLMKIGEIAEQYQGLRGKAATIQGLTCPTDDEIEVGATGLLDDLREEIEVENRAVIGDILPEPEEEGRTAEGVK